MNDENGRAPAHSDAPPSANGSAPPPRIGPADLAAAGLPDGAVVLSDADAQPVRMVRLADGRMVPLLPKGAGIALSADGLPPGAVVYGAPPSTVSADGLPPGAVVYGAPPSTISADGLPPGTIAYGAPPSTVSAGGLPPGAIAYGAPPGAGSVDSGGGRVESGVSAPLPRVPDAVQVDTRSEELQELIGYVPGALVRWGTTAVFLTVVALLGVAWWVKYPEMVRGMLTLTTATPPARIVARGAGEVQRAFVADGQRVPAGAPLVLLRNPARYADVMRVKAWADSADPAAAAAAPDFGGAELGEVQAPLAELQRALSDLRAFDAAGYYGEKLSTLQAQGEDQRRLGEALRRRLSLAEEEVGIADREWERMRELARRGLVPAADLEKAEAARLQKRQALEDARNTITSSEIQMSGYRAQALDLERGRDDERRRFQLAARAAHGALRAAIAQWEQAYLLRAPTAGRVSFFRPLPEGAYVAASEPLLALVPDAGGALARVEVAHAGAGRVAVGQKAVLRFDSYPANDFGTVEGRVERISLLAREVEGEEGAVYLVEVSLPHGLRTSFGRTLPFRQEMRGDARIVTRDLRLIDRVFSSLRAAADG